MVIKMCQKCVKLATEISKGMEGIAFDGFQDAMFLTLNDEYICESFMFVYEMGYHHLTKTITMVLLDEIQSLIKEVLL